MSGLEQGIGLHEWYRSVAILNLPPPKKKKPKLTKSFCEGSEYIA